MRFADLEIHSIESQLFAENTYTIWRNGQTDCLIVDPGLQAQELIEYLRAAKLEPAAILNTHGHSDHIAGNEVIKSAWPEAPLIIGEDDAYKLTDADANLSAPFGMPLLSPVADQTVAEGDVLEFAGISLKVLATPGHSKGHIVFLYEGSPTLVFGGDVLFRGSVGRTDFFDGSFEELRDSIHQKLFPLPADTVVFPGHGPETRVGDEIQFNPFVGVPAGYVAS